MEGLRKSLRFVKSIVVRGRKYEPAKAFLTVKTVTSKVNPHKHDLAKYAKQCDLCESSLCIRFCCIPLQERRTNAYNIVTGGDNSLQPI